MIDYNELNKPKKAPVEKGLSTERISDLVYRNLANIVIVIVSVVFLFQGFFRPGLSETPFWIRMASSLLSIIVAILISSMMGLQGMMRGLEFPRVIAVNEEHEKIIVAANDYVEYADEWADYENKMALIKARTHILSSAGLKYSYYFDEDGHYTEKVPEKPDTEEKSLIKQYKTRLKKLDEAVNINLTPVSFISISTSSKVNYDINSTGYTPEEFHVRSTSRKVLTKLTTVAILGNITWTLIVAGNGLESLFNGAIQLAMFFLFGALDYFKNYNYVTRNNVDNIRNKINSAKRLITFGEKKRGEINARQREIRFNESNETESTREHEPDEAGKLDF